MRYNPFRPNGLVAPGMFSGRMEEIGSIEQSLLQTKNGNPQHFLIEGERGIGKSSLMLIARALAYPNEGKEGEFNFLVLEIELANSTTYLEMIRKVG